MTLAENKRRKRDERLTSERQLSLQLLLKRSLPLSRIVALTKVPYSTCCRLLQNHKAVNFYRLQKLLRPGSNRPGGRPHLTSEQENLIAERLIFAGRRGFAADVNDFKSLMSQIARMNGRPFKNGLLIDGTVRMFRTKHRD